MIINIVFLVFIIISLIRAISYGIYCMKRTVVGGISVFALALGVMFCGAMVIW